LSPEKIELGLGRHELRVGCRPAVAVENGNDGDVVVPEPAIEIQETQGLQGLCGRNLEIERRLLCALP
jgi:hypothetical protein